MNMPNLHMARAVKRADPISPSRCPHCGGKLELSDNSASFKARYRYALGCKDKDCEIVFAPSIRAAVKLWNDTCQQPAKLV